MYIPKNKIQTNLNSQGEYFLKSTGQPYYGPYFIMAGDKAFTGKEPNDGKNLPLEKNNNNVDVGDTLGAPIDLRFTPENENYSLLKGLDPNSPPQRQRLPIPFVPQPTKENYENGEILRVFVKKSNENIYYEVESNRYSPNPRYFTFIIPWLISGEKDYVAQTNQKTVELYMREFPIPAFNKFLKDDYLKFWKPS